MPARRGGGGRSGHRLPGPYVSLVALLLLTATPALLLVWLLPLPLVLPALSITSFTIAAGIALYAYCSGADRRCEGLSLWDVAGLFAVIWIVAGMFSEPENVLRLFGYLTMAE
jgi:hypothetical protein